MTYLDKKSDITSRPTNCVLSEDRKLLNNYISDLIFILQESLEQTDMEIVQANLWDVQHYMDTAIAQCNRLCTLPQ